MKCRECLNFNLTAINYKDHFISCHLRSSAKNNLKKIPCPLCDYQSSTIGLFESHFNRIHPSEAIGFTLITPPPTVSFQRLVNHSIQKQLPCSKNLYSNPIYKENPIEVVTPQSVFDNQSNSFNLLDELSEILPNPNSSEQDLLFESDNRPTESSYNNDGNSIFQRKVIDCLNSIRSEHSITESALRQTADKLTNLYHEEFNNQPFSFFRFEEAKSVINSTYRRNQVSGQQSPYYEQATSRGTVYYNSIKSIIAEYLKVPQFFSEILSERNKEREENVICSIYDLPKIKELERNLTENEINFYFDLYFDAKLVSTNIANRNCNMEFVYLSTPNVRYKHQSQRKSIGLVAIGSHRALEELKIEKFFEPIKEDIKSLGPFEMNGYVINPLLFSVKADNKGSNEMIVDIPKSFYMTRACKSCYVHYEDLLDLAIGLQRPLSDQHVLFGVYHVTDSLYAPCNFHNQDEGVIEKWAITLVFRANELSEFNNRIQEFSKQFKDWINLTSFNLSFGDSRSEIKMRRTGIQKHQFFVFYCLLNRAHHLDEKHSECYRLLKAIVDFCNSSKVYESDLPFLDKLIYKYLKKYRECFPNQSITFKMHNMVHYSVLVLEFGPLIFSSTLRYERVHQKIMRSIEGSRNKQNLSHSIFNAFKMDIESSFTDEKHVIKTFNNLNEIDLEFRVYMSSNNLSNREQIFELDLIKIDNQKFLKNKVYLYSYKQTNIPLPIFILIKKIFLADQRVLIFGRLLVSDLWDPKLMSYRVILTPELIKLDINKIQHHEHLPTFTNNQSSFVLKTFHVPFDVSNSYLDLLNEYELSTYPQYMNLEE